MLFEFFLPTVITGILTPTCLECAILARRKISHAAEVPIVGDNILVEYEWMPSRPYESCFFGRKQTTIITQHHHHQTVHERFYHSTFRVSSVFIYSP